MDLTFRVKVRSDGYIDPQQTHNNIQRAIENGWSDDGVKEITISADKGNPAPLTPDVRYRPQDGEPVSE